MERIENLYLYDKDGNEYIFEFYPIGTRFRDIPGVYVFVKRTTNQHGVSKDIILYVGQTNSFKTRQIHNNNHHKLLDAELEGVTHIGVLEILPEDKDIRRSIEIALIATYNPPLNETKG